MQIDYPGLAKRICHYRERAGKSCQQIADVIGLEESEYLKLEDGESLATLEQVFSLSQALGVTMNQLCEDGVMSGYLADDLTPAWDAIFPLHGSIMQSTVISIPSVRSVAPIQEQGCSQGVFPGFAVRLADIPDPLIAIYDSQESASAARNALLIAMEGIHGNN